MQAIAAIPGIGPVLPYLVLGGLVNALIVAPSLAPPATAGSFYGFAYRVANACAGNFGHARNANAPEAPPSPLAPPRPLAWLVALGMAVTLSACGTLPKAPAGSPAASVQSGIATAQANVQGVVTATLADEQADAAAALKLAAAATPAPDTEFSNCLSYLQGAGAPLVAQLGTVGTPLCSAPVCALSAFEKGRLSLMGGLNMASPTSKTALETACGPLDLSIRNQAMTAGAEAAALLAVLGVRVAVPALAAAP
jgi:hypothetical protein